MRLKFNVLLTNNFVSFEQHGPAVCNRIFQCGSLNRCIGSDRVIYSFMCALYIIFDTGLTKLYIHIHVPALPVFGYLPGMGLISQPSLAFSKYFFL